MAFTNEIVRAVWEKGTIISNNDPAIWRKDACGAWMRWSDYGNRNSQYGWEVDHINPHGTDALSNLRPLQWENNTDKSDGRLRCNVTSSGPDNTRR